MRVLVTGAAGFIGSNLCAALLGSGHTVVGLDDLSAGTRENLPAGVEFHRGDIGDPGTWPLYAGADAVFHLAARNCLADCMAHPVETSVTNVAGTASVLEGARRAGVGRVVYAGSSAEYEGVAELPSRVERVKPLGTYAVSKRAGGLLCESYAHLHGMAITQVRYFNVYGPAQDWRRVIPPVISAFVLKLLRGERPAIYGTGEKRRDFIYVDDVNALHLLLLQDPRTVGQVYNLGTGRNHSVNEIFGIIEGMLRTELQPEYRDDLPGEAEATLAEISRERALGWEPRIGIEEGIRRSIEYLRHSVLAHAS